MTQDRYKVIIELVEGKAGCNEFYLNDRGIEVINWRCDPDRFLVFGLRVPKEGVLQVLDAADRPERVEVSENDSGVINKVYTYLLKRFPSEMEAIQNRLKQVA